MSVDALTGMRVYLSAYDLEKDPAVMVKWMDDSEYRRLLDSDAVILWNQKQLQKFLEEEGFGVFAFAIRTIEDDRLIGDIGLGGINWPAGSAWVGIGLGERADWGKGYGSDAMQVLLRYAFEQLNLRRVNLNVFEYNPRAIRSYEKVGFVHEGRARQWVQREGRRWDSIYMGILRREWEALAPKRHQLGYTW